MLLVHSVKAGVQFYGCKAFGFSHAYCLSAVLMK
jgi:hypothetical protein